MAEVNPLILPIGADPRSLQKSFAEVQTAFKNLEKSLKGKKFSAITNEERQELEGYRRTLIALNDDLNGVNLDKLEKGSKSARTAFQSLNLVVQDLPFGFIAIQNNLPALFQSFGKLAAESGGALATLKALGAAIGPAGALFFAFTAITSAVTFAQQEFGSLTNAVKVLFGANGAAVKAQNEFNKALLDGGGDAGVQIAKINILVKTIQSETSTQNERLAAYRELKKISPEVVSGIDEQNLATAKSIKLIGENAKAVIELTKLQVKQRGIQAALSKLEEERFAINGKFNKARQDEINLQKEIAVAEQKRESGLKISSRENQLLVKKDAFLQTAADRVQEFRDEVIKNTSAQDVWYKSLEQSVTATSQISSNLETLQNNLEAETKKANEAADANKKLAKAREEQLRFAGDIRSLRNAKFLTEPELELPKKIEPKKYLEPIFRGLEKLPGAEVPAIVDLLFPEETFKQIQDAWSRINSETAPKLEDIRQTIINSLLADYIQKKLPLSLDNVQKKIDEVLGGIRQKITDTQGITQRFTLAQNIGENLRKQLETQTKEFEKVKSSIENNLEKPLREFFDTLLTDGKLSFDTFVEFAKDAFKRILAQAIASGIASLLANILTGGGAAVTKFTAAQVGAAGGIAKALTSFGGILRREAAPSLGGIQSGGMNLNGQVVFVQRGSDLVGVLNRTNSTIGRIG